MGWQIQIDWSLLIDLATLPPSASADRALDQLGRRDIKQVSVLEGARLQDIVRRRDLVRWLAFHPHGSHA